MIIESRFREIREQRGLTQQAVAVRARCSGSMLVGIERYGYVPGDRVRQKLAKILEVPESELWPGLRK